MLYAKIKSGENSCDTTKARFHDDIECSLEQKDGFLPLVNGNEKPDQPDEYINYHLEVSDGNLVKTYSAGEMPQQPKPPRRFSVFAFEIACFRAGILAKVDEFIDSQTITDENTGATMKLRRAYERVTEFVEDNPYFAPYYQAGLAYCGLTVEQGESILANCVMD